MFTPKDFVHRLKMLATITLSPPQRSVRLQRGSKESVGLQGPTVSLRFMSFKEGVRQIQLTVHVLLPIFDPEGCGQSPGSVVI